MDNPYGKQISLLGIFTCMVLIAVLGILVIVFNSSQTMRFVLGLLMLADAIILVVFCLLAINKCWRVTEVLRQERRRPLSARVALLYMLIPGFNLYWIPHFFGIMYSDLVLLNKRFVYNESDTHKKVFFISMAAFAIMILLSDISAFSLSCVLFVWLVSIVVYCVYMANFYLSKTSIISDPATNAANSGINGFGGSIKLSITDFIGDVASGASGGERESDATPAERKTAAAAPDAADNACDDSAWTGETVKK